VNTENRCHSCKDLLHKRRNPTQRYCGKALCQKQRKNKWRHAKRHGDADYQYNQQQANTRWQKTHPAYWRQYRANHPDYVCRNREKQKIRDQARQQGAGSFLAKSDAFIEKNVMKSGIYRVIPLECHLAKSDAFTVKMERIS
jgi:hypothetical protein